MASFSGPGTIGAGRGRSWQGRGSVPHSKNAANAASKAEVIPAHLIDPLKVYVGNLRASVTDHDLKKIFSHYANVVRAFIVKDKNTQRSRCFGFVELATTEDVRKVLELKNGDTYIYGKQAIIKPAKKKCVLPGDYDFVKVPLSDRLFDLEPEKPSEPCIHVLVDDVMYKILGLLPLRTLIGVERVCRRWQMMVHKMFTRRTSFKLSRETVGIYGPLTRSIVGKLLILMGPTLKELKVENVDYSTKHNILKMISQLCPELESLDVTQTMGINFSNLKALSRGCRKLKTFIAQECPDFDDRSLREILQSYPNLQHLDIGGWYFEGKDFGLLPATLKVLGLPVCHSIRFENLKLIGDRCPELEVLNLHQVLVDKDVLEHIGTKCPVLKEFKLSIASPSAESLLFYKNIKVLELEIESYFEIAPVIEHMSNLEELTLKGAGEDLTQKTKLNFSTFKHLREVHLIRVGISGESLKTLCKCSTLKSLRLHTDLEPDLFLNILRGCPLLESFSSSRLDVSVDLVKSINDIMKLRTGPLKISAQIDRDIKPEDFDDKKINLENFSNLHYLLSVDSDYDDYDYDNDSIFSTESMDEWWMYGGYGSDNSFPEDFVFRDHIDDIYFLPYWCGDDDDDDD